MSWIFEDDIDADRVVTRIGVPAISIQQEGVKVRGPWTYDESDPAICLFTAADRRFNFTIRPGSRLLELGCAETDFLERLHRWDPSLNLVGVDARAELGRQRDPGINLFQASAMDRDLFPPDSFDWIVLLGALEHFGLGFYGDPIDEDGDTYTMANVARWLRPGGFVYFDVPCQPTYRIQPNRHFRSYAPTVGDGRPGSVAERLIVPGLTEITRAYSLPEPWAGTWCHEPTVDRVPYWFVAVLAQKDA
jgi:SAM-dependent methyltransferase